MRDDDYICRGRGPCLAPIIGAPKIKPTAIIKGSRTGPGRVAQSPGASSQQAKVAKERLSKWSNKYRCFPSSLSLINQ